ncbi:hypothetical protein FVR03_08915 [Pontibacter qinzhouensis]|uniref:Uncharacterized protein n=1 Tax=Pontibacter qinzhouensis TaxID=2603253 RepID=A0A5C8KBL9_9BACT|nr:hypothetical protein [Pontibacter qinzhouensis]TXK47657.1 hypothetical protein FVR03_08915 [Pontibacter qinzhouensis]
MSKLYTTIILLEDYPDKFENTKARDISILPTLYAEATTGLGLDINFEQIEILKVETEEHGSSPLEVKVKWQIKPSVQAG